MITKTAATLTPSELTRYRRQLKAREIFISDQMQSRLARASQVAAQAALLLREQFSARQVVVFGSVVTPELFHPRSDIDLAVWGLESRDYYRAVGVLQAIDPDFSIDLVSYEEASTDMQAVIQRDGVVL